jgi:hypothetical protein
MSSGGGKTTSVTNTKADPWSGVQPYLSSLYGQAAALGATPQQFYPGQTYASMSTPTLAGIENTEWAARNAIPALITKMRGGMDSMLGAADVANNPYVNNMLGQQASQLGNAFNQTYGRLQSGYGDLATDVTERLQREWLPGIRSGATGAGQYGGTRQGIAEGLAMSNATDQLARYGQEMGRELSSLGTNQAQSLANAAAQTQLGAYGQGLEQQRAAMALAPAQAQLELMPAQLQQQAGALREGWSQRGIDEAMARYNFAQQDPWLRLQQMNSIFSGIPWETTATATGSKSGSAGAGALGGGMLGGSLGSGLGSMLGASALGTGISTGLGLPAYMSLGSVFGPVGAIGGALLGGLL